MDPATAVADLTALVRAHADPARAAEMSAYMRGQFDFLGIPRSRLTPLVRPWLTTWRGVPSGPVLAATEALYAECEREFVYVAVALLERQVVRFEPDDVARLLPLIDARAWWDSVDAIRKPLGMWARHEPGRAAPMVAELLAGSMWRRRVAITLQLQWKQETDTRLLATAIDANLDDREFFIQKAIGWALREYAKTDPQWVRRFLAERAITGLALSEATKHLRQSADGS